MHIYSKILELDVLTADYVLPDRYMEDAELLTTEVKLKTPMDEEIQVNSLFCSGLYIQESQMKSGQQDFSESFLTTGPHIRFFFYIDGHSSVCRGAGNQDYNHQVGMLQYNYLDDVGGGGTINITAGDYVHYIVLKMSKDFFMELSADEPWMQEDRFFQQVKTSSPENLPNQTCYMQAPMLSVLHDILYAQSLDSHRFYYVKIKLKELLFSIHQLWHLQKQKNSLSSNVVEELEQVRAYLLLNLVDPPSIRQLSKRFGISEKRLKKDFKDLYNTTIYAYVVRQRMEHAILLLNGDCNVNELAASSGYQSVSHFIKVFKSHFKYTPKEYIQRQSSQGPTSKLK